MKEEDFRILKALKFLDKHFSRFIRSTNVFNRHTQKAKNNFNRCIFPIRLDPTLHIADEAQLNMVVILTKQQQFSVKVTGNTTIAIEKMQLFDVVDCREKLKT